MVLKQYHLNLDGMSGRGVRVRMLSPSEVAKSDRDGSAVAGPKAGLMDLRAAQQFEGLKRMLVEVTTDAGLKELQGDAVRWTKVTLQDLDMPGPRHIDVLFTPRDIGALQNIFARLHEVRLDEVDALMGKALDVASEG
jgi:hypothetical protein